MPDLSRELDKLLRAEHVSVSGVADLIDHQQSLQDYGGEIVKGYPFGISIGIALPDSIVDLLDRRFDVNVASEYYFNAYQLINVRLNDIATKVSMFLNGNGHRTLPIPAAERTDLDRAIPTVSHKMIAHLAGLGWIGKNCLLITPQYGPRIRFVSLLTHAPLRPAKKAMVKCGPCMECVNICPVKAIKGVNYKPGEPREVRFDFRICQGYYKEMEKDEKRKPVCGMCLYICPFGKKGR
jgi:epoxyqueuosine reductase